MSTNKCTFFENVSPVKLTDCWKLRLNEKGWGILTEFYLESVKINKYKDGVNSIAIFKVGDASGQITCIAKGPILGLLFDLTPKEWKEVEKLNNCGQLFYRYFKNGLKPTFNYEQKLFYNFCMTGQTKSVLVAIFRRSLNTRNVDKDEVIIEILDLRPCSDHYLDLYLGHFNEVLNKTS